MLASDRNLTIKSLYTKLINLTAMFLKTSYGRSKSQLRLKFSSLWLKNILTEDNLLRRGWVGSKMCIFCGRDETVNHLFFQCYAASFVQSLLKCDFILNSTPNAFSDFFGNWIRSSPKNDKKLVLARVSNFLVCLEMQK